MNMFIATLHLHAAESSSSLLVITAPHSHTAKMDSASYNLYLQHTADVS